MKNGPGSMSLGTALLAQFTNLWDSMPEFSGHVKRY
jgi:hypothetical protein